MREPLSKEDREDKHDYGINGIFLFLQKPVAWYWLIVLLIAFFGGLFLGYIVFGANIFNCTID